MGCFWSIVFLAAFVLIMVTFIRWFEQTTEAVDNGWWNKLGILVAMPFAVWFFPSKVGAGRSTPVPHHEPVRGFGKVSLEPPKPPSTDQPPPGTPKEFLGMPKITQAKPRAGPDPEKLAKLKQKMREQGMLPPEGE
jgi:hypothetical protein